ncbi:hypothetical protein WKI71_00210 [Streptomyces sp. MS1.AVA.1]|uniref:Uncharacterized protein n=1 Tax=Streptomyces machairae TaxID=3134109 RepID=A0ABU8UG88_9ACTN
MVSADQLKQSQANADKESRGQAALVSSWVESRNSWKVHVLNRSADPIPHVRVAFDAVLVTPGPPSPGAPSHVRYVLEERGLAPCTELVYTEKTLDPVVTEGLRNDALFDEKIGAVEVQYVVLVDRDGKTWRRTSNSLTPWEDDRDPEQGLPESPWHGQAREPQVKHAAACGEAEQ